jgi:NAD(P)H-hydrate epimerase
LLRCLTQWGRECALVTAGAREPELSLLHGVAVARTTGERAPDYDVIVDGVLGTGAQGAPRGAAAVAIEQLMGAGRPVLALDVPSGVDGTTGAVVGGAVRAAATVTFGWPKLGLLLHPGRGYAGRLIAVEIAFPPLPSGSASAALITPEWVRVRLPRGRRTHKAHRAGCSWSRGGKDGGAAAVAAEAAVDRYRAGAVAARRQPRDRQGLVPSDVFDRAMLPPGCGDITAAVIGLVSAAGQCRWLALERTASVPTLLDADARNLLSQDATGSSRSQRGPR